MHCLANTSLYGRAISLLWFDGSLPFGRGLLQREYGYLGVAPKALTRK